MKLKIVNIFLFILSIMNAQEKETEKFQLLAFGSIKPSGWIKIQMEKDINGFVGNLDQIVPDLINDPIYGIGRLQKHSKTKELGNLKEGDADGNEQYMWWNSETQSNWWDGYLRNVLLLNEKVGLEKVKKYIYAILATQDDDGYLGIYTPELRYQFHSENGELWSKTTLFRGLLAYYEYSKDVKVWNALKKAVDNVMQNYPINASSPFSSGEKFNGGVSHGLTFTDVLDRMYQITGDKKYVNYALFLYQDFSNTFQSEKDAQLDNILNPDYKLQSHGVHTFEHLRPLIVAAYANKNSELQNALAVYIQRIENATTLTGGAIGDEWIAERLPNATHTGYEYCSLQELLDSYTVLLQKKGQPKIADEIETIFYNAAQGSRDPNHSCIAYLKTDNSFEMEGTKNGEIEPNRKQTRYKYSPAHQDVAVCCNPNAGRISPYFIEKSWMKQGNNSLVAAILSPNILETTIDNNPIRIEEITEYPFKNNFIFKIYNPKKTNFILKIRKPIWATEVVTNEKFTLENGFIVLDRKFNKEDQIQIKFKASIIVKEDANHEKYFTYGAQVFAKSISATEHKGKIYKGNFFDITYTPKENTKYIFIPNNNAKFENEKIYVTLKNSTTNELENVELVPFGQTILRQVAF